MAAVKSKGGRPTASDVGKLDAKIVAAATKLFLHDGYGATSIEAIAKAAGVSKRTLYHRYNDKSELFSAVMHQLIINVTPPEGIEGLFQGSDLKQILARIASLALHAALSKDALALRRLLVSESKRFPVLARIIGSEGSRGQAIEGLAKLLANEVARGNIKVTDPLFAAEHFLQMIVSRPRDLALGLGEALDEHELEVWIKDTVDFFLNACRI